MMRSRNKNLDVNVGNAFNRKVSIIIDVESTCELNLNYSHEGFK